MIKAICTMMPYVKTALKGVRMERAERVLDVAYKVSDNSSPGSNTSDPNDDEATRVGL